VKSARLLVLVFAVVLRRPAFAGDLLAAEVKLTPTPEQLQAEKVVDQYGPALLKIPGVNGYGVGADQSGNVIISVHVDAVTPAVESAVPRTLGGFRVQIIQMEPPTLEGRHGSCGAKKKVVARTQH